MNFLKNLGARVIFPWAFAQEKITRRAIRSNLFIACGAKKDFRFYPLRAEGQREV